MYGYADLVTDYARIVNCPQRYRIFLGQSTVNRHSRRSACSIPTLFSVANFLRGEIRNPFLESQKMSIVWGHAPPRNR